jgi:hypothetical protein
MGNIFAINKSKKNKIKNIEHPINKTKIYPNRLIIVKVSGWKNILCDQEDFFNVNIK